ncbi:hypothetical protein BDZ89DRAFT_546548 [Hymenopellis radicata]|nr:hypothetical protein BDZ89DRAFT_546548 [Hymenopellis radicata]
MRGRRYTDAPGTTWETVPTGALPPPTRCRLGMRSAIYFELGPSPSYHHIQTSSAMTSAPSTENILINSADIAINSPEVARQLADTVLLPSTPLKTPATFDRDARRKGTKGFKCVLQTSRRSMMRKRTRMKRATKGQMKINSRMV